MEETILAYLSNTYHPHTIVVYGSYQNGTYDKESDFDVLLITDNGQTQHDGRIVEGVKLDAFIYATCDFRQDQDLSKYIQLYGGKIIQDDQQIAVNLLEELEAYINVHAVTSENEKIHLKEWCCKMLDRVQRGDTEGMFRWHWLLEESLEIYCNLRDLFYFGPKKTLLWIKQNDIEGYFLVDKALRHLEYSVLEAWITYVMR